MIDFKNSLHLLTDKPVLYIGNIGESNLMEKKNAAHEKFKRTC